MKKKNYKISIVDYGVGNLFSVARAFRKFAASVNITEDPSEINDSDGLVLPGVGSFGSGMEGLKLRGLAKAVKDFAKSGKPIIGICLGAQLLLDEGHEFGKFKGLGVIPGRVVKFPTIKAKIPQIGWNEVIIKDKNDSVLGSVKNLPHFYFVHSYILEPENKKDVLATTSYGNYEFCSAVKRGKIYGCQFHPEKSGRAGIKIIQNFVNLVTKHE